MRHIILLKWWNNLAFFTLISWNNGFIPIAPKTTITPPKYSPANKAIKANKALKIEIIQKTQYPLYWAFWIRI